MKEYKNNWINFIELLNSSPTAKKIFIGFMWFIQIIFIYYGYQIWRLLH